MAHNPEPFWNPVRKQIAVGIVMGVLTGIVIGALTGFWWWVPAGIAVGLAAGVIIKPPQA